VSLQEEQAPGDWASHNTDKNDGSTANASWIRWRHANNQSCNFTFPDGHAGGIRLYQLKYKNIVVRFTRTAGTWE